MNKAMICCTSIHLPPSKPAKPELTLKKYREVKPALG